jgi:proteasome lid subunit RPN8/RPN11
MQCAPFSFPVTPTVRIRQNVLSALLAQARRSPETEVCGLLSGRDGEVIEIFPAANASAKPETSFEIGPRELFQNMRTLRRAKLDLLGIYHSHPRTLNEPSPTDISLAFYPEVAYFIVSPREDVERPVRAFIIRNGAAKELNIEVVT